MLVNKSLGKYPELKQLKGESYYLEFSVSAWYPWKVEDIIVLVFVSLLVGWLLNRSVCLLVGCFVSQFVVGCLVGQFVGWMVV